MAKPLQWPTSRKRLSKSYGKTTKRVDKTKKYCPNCKTIMAKKTAKLLLLPPSLSISTSPTKPSFRQPPELSTCGAIEVARGVVTIKGGHGWNAKKKRRNPSTQILRMCSFRILWVDLRCDVYQLCVFCHRIIDVKMLNLCFLVPIQSSHLQDVALLQSWVLGQSKSNFQMLRLAAFRCDYFGRGLN